MEHRTSRLWRTLFALPIVGACSVAACGDVGTRGAGLTTADSAGVRVTTIAADAVRALPEWDLAEPPDHVIDAASVGDSTAFALIGPVAWLGDGSLAVTDLGATRIHVFDSAGTHRSSIGRRGQGPGDFRTISSITPLRHDTLAVFDGSQRRLTFWTVDSGFQRQLDLRDGGSLDAWPADAWPWRDSLVVVLQLSVTPRPVLATGEAARRWPMRAQLALLDSAGRALAVGPRFQAMYTAVFPGGDARAPFSHNPFAVPDGERVVFGSGDRFQIATLGATFRLTSEVRAPVLDESFDRAEATRLFENTLALLSTRMPVAEARARIAPSFDPAVFPERRPSIGRVVADAGGRLWVERFEPMRLGAQLQVPGDRWTVLAPDGRPIARLRLPPRTRLEAVRGDRVAVVRWDDLDVQSVAIHGLRR